MLLKHCATCLQPQRRQRSERLCRHRCVRGTQRTVCCQRGRHRRAGARVLQHRLANRLQRLQSECSNFQTYATESASVYVVCIVQYKAHASSGIDLPTEFSASGGGHKGNMRSHVRRRSAAVNEKSIAFVVAHVAIGCATRQSVRRAQTTTRATNITSCAADTGPTRIRPSAAWDMIICNELAHSNAD